jgi:hypothetical protein
MATAALSCWPATEHELLVRAAGVSSPVLPTTEGNRTGYHGRRGVCAVAEYDRPMPAVSCSASERRSSVPVRGSRLMLSEYESGHPVPPRPLLAIRRSGHLDAGRLTAYSPRWTSGLALIHWRSPPVRVLSTWRSTAAAGRLSRPYGATSARPPRPPGSAATGRSRTGSTGSATLPTRRTNRWSERETRPA